MKCVIWDKLWCMWCVTCAVLDWCFIRAWKCRKHRFCCVYLYFRCIHVVWNMFLLIWGIRNITWGLFLQSVGHMAREATGKVSWWGSRKFPLLNPRWGGRTPYHYGGGGRDPWILAHIYIERERDIITQGRWITHDILSKFSMYHCTCTARCDRRLAILDVWYDTLAFGLPKMNDMILVRHMWLFMFVCMFVYGWL